MSAPRILLLVAGRPAPELARETGGYASWFAEVFGDRADLSAVNAFAGDALPRPRDFDGVVMTGSPLSVTDYDHTPWMQSAGAHLLACADSGIPVLGVCFGHQLLARAAGGHVEKNIRGREIGTVEIALTEVGRSQSLLGTLGAAPHFHATHLDVVTTLPPDAVLLAENAFGIQAFSLGVNALAVQFHPELDATRIRAVIDSRREALRGEGIYEQALASIRESTFGPALLTAWLESIQSPKGTPQVP